MSAYPRAEAVSSQARPASTQRHRPLEITDHGQVQADPWWAQPSWMSQHARPSVPRGHGRSDPAQGVTTGIAVRARGTHDSPSIREA